MSTPETRTSVLVPYGSPEWEAWWDAEVKGHTWAFVCIGTGPGPKNVMARREDGLPIVFSYRNWKRLKKENTVSEGQSEGVWIVSMGMIQQFKKDGEYKPVSVTKDVSGQSVTEFTIKSTSQKLITVSLWPEFAALVPHIVKGAGVFVEGKLRENVSNGVTYYNLTASQIAFVSPVTRTEREVVNAQQPVAAAAAAAPAAGAAPQIF